MLLTLFAQAQPIPRAAADSLSRLLLATTTQIDTNRINLLLRLGAYYLYKPLELETDLDSARQCARQAEALSRILHFPKGLTHSLELLGNISMEAQEIAKAKVYYQAQLHSARGANDVRGVAQACLLLARTYMVSRRDSLVQMNLVRRALQLYHQMKDKDKEAETWRTLADFHQLYGNYPQALYELDRALQLEETQPVGSPYYVYDLMAHVQQQLGNYGQAVRYSLESIRKAQALGDTSHIQTFYLRLGWLYYELNEWDEGIVYMKKLMSIHQKRNQVGGVIATAEVITDGLIHQKKYPEALEYVKRTLQQIKTLEALQRPNPVSQVAFSRMLARVYFHNGQYGEAEKYYRRRHNMSENIVK